MARGGKKENLHGPHALKTYELPVRAATSYLEQTGTGLCGYGQILGCRALASPIWSHWVG